MKRFGALAVAALLVVGLVGSAALAAPTLSGEFKIESTTTLSETDDDINFTGEPGLSLKLEAAEAGLWKLSTELGKVDSLDIGKYYLELTPGPFSFYAWGNGYETSTVADAFSFISSGKANAVAEPKFRLATAVAGVNLTADYVTRVSVDDKDTSANEDKPEDRLFVFAKTGAFGVAFRDTNVGDTESGMGASADAGIDLGLGKLTVGAALDLQAPAGKGSVAFGVKGESEVAPGLTVNAGYTSDARGKDKAETTISAGAEYKLEVITFGADLSLENDGSVKTTTVGGSVSYGETASASVEYSKSDDPADKTPTLALKANAAYPVIADVLKVSADFEMVSDKEPFASGDDYEWVNSDAWNIGDVVASVLKLSASAPYTVTPALTVTPGAEYAAYTFEGTDSNAKATILKLDATYKVSDAASLSFGIARVDGEVKNPPTVDHDGKDGTADLVLENVKETRLKAVVSVKF